MNPEVAIVIPFYNAADTLPTLIDALRNQQFADFTAIFVDDGSTDGGDALVTGAGDSRFRLLKGRHDGPGLARNIGLEAADAMSVEFVAFADADDMPAPEMLSRSVDRIREAEADIVHFRWSDRIGGAPAPDSLGGPAIYVWNKLYRRSAIKGVRFVDAKFSEDLAFFLETSARSPRRVGIDEVLYVHTRRPGSLWESRGPGEVALSTRRVVAHLNPLLRECPSRQVAKAWREVHLPKLMLRWRRMLGRNLRVVRTRAKGEYVEFAKGLFRDGWLSPWGSGVRGFRRCLLLRMSVWCLALGRAASSCRDRFFVALLKRRYQRTLGRLRKNIGSGASVYVFFMVSEVSKWKCQSVYDAMAKSGRYTPCLFCDVTTDELKLPRADRVRAFRDRVDYFRERGLTVLEGYDPSADKVIQLAPFRPDIVFYQQPWQMPRDRLPRFASRRALTCYVAYYVQNYGSLDIDCRMDFHRDIFAYFVLSQVWADHYAADMSKRGQFAAELVATGHPMLDVVPRNSLSSDGPVIYAPHWTVDTGRTSYLLPVGTFSWSGNAVLDYAKLHPEYGWVFKPHPNLRRQLVATGFMTESEVEKYYANWAEVASVCQDGDYMKWFAASRALVTDSASFLPEYAATGKPIVHLVPPGGGVKPLEPHRRLFAGFYRAQSREQLFGILKEILEDGRDPLADERHSAARQAGLAESDAAGNIVSWLDEKIFNGGAT